jgi:hypothetical protein
MSTLPSATNHSDAAIAPPKIHHFNVSSYWIPLLPFWTTNKEDPSQPLLATSAPLHANLFVSEACLLTSLHPCPSIDIIPLDGILESGGKSQVTLKLTGHDSQDTIP